MASEMWGLKLAVLVVGLLALVPETTQLRVGHPLFNLVQRLNTESGPFLGLVISDNRYTKALKNSTYFTPHQAVPSITMAGRKFYFGKFNDIPAIYVLAGEPLANVAVTTQILIDSFNLTGVINIGAAATVSNKVFIANVVVPTKVAYTGSWTWQKYESSSTLNDAPSLNFGDYNLPEAGENSLAGIEFQKVPVYTATSSKQKKTLWIDMHSDWIKIAAGINFGERPTVLIGSDVKVGSADIYMLNTAYGEFLNSQLGVSAIDTESAAFVTTAIANNVPYIVFRGAANRPGLDTDNRLKETTAKNVINTMATFVDAINPMKKYSIVY